jgi:hypothetical protein
MPPQKPKICPILSAASGDETDCKSNCMWYRGNPETGDGLCAVTDLVGWMADLVTLANPKKESVISEVVKKD